jgi:hypothetical protein
MVPRVPFASLFLVGQYEAMKKKSPETTNNIPARGSFGGSTRLPSQGRSEGAACHRGSGSHLPAQGSSRCVACHRGTGSHLQAQGSSGVGTYPLCSSTRLPVQGSSGGAACPHGSEPDEDR